MKLIPGAPLQQKLLVVQAMAAAIRRRTCAPNGGLAQLLTLLTEGGDREVIDAIVEHLGPGYLRLAASASKVRMPSSTSSSDMQVRPLEDSETEESDILDFALDSWIA